VIIEKTGTTEAAGKAIVKKAHDSPYS